MFELPVKAFMNASFYTMREEGECFEALVTRGDRIWKLTTAEEAQEIAREHGGEVVDLKGCTVLPGFIDAHQHVQAYAGNLAKVNLREANSVEELKEKIRERAAVTPKGELIQGAGFGKTGNPPEGWENWPQQKSSTQQRAAMNTTRSRKWWRKRFRKKCATASPASTRFRESR